MGYIFVTRELGVRSVREKKIFTNYSLLITNYPPILLDYVAVLRDPFARQGSKVANQALLRTAVFVVQREW